MDPEIFCPSVPPDFGDVSAVCPVRISFPFMSVDRLEMEAIAYGILDEPEEPWIIVVNNLRAERIPEEEGGFLPGYPSICRVYRVE